MSVESAAPAGARRGLDLPGQLHRVSFAATPPPATCAVGYRVDSQWGTGFTVTVTLTNTGPEAIGPLLVIAGIKERRRKKRRDAATGDARAAGAWDEMLDRYSELGYAVPGKTTRVHVADELQDQLPDDAPIQLRTIAVSTDEAVFSGLQIDEQHSEAVWTEALAAVELAHEAVSGVRRLLSRFRIRSARDWAARVSRADGSGSAPVTAPAGRRAARPRPGARRKAPLGD